MSDAGQPPRQPPAGFYPDATGTMRWWDGSSWTEHTQASSPPPQQEMPPAGWHPDPRGGSDLRYWDGSQWTEHVAPAATAHKDEQLEPTAILSSPREHATHIPPPEDGPVTAWIKDNKPLTVFTAVIVALIVLIALVPTEDPGEEPTSSAVSESPTPSEEPAIESPEPDITEAPEPESRVPSKQQKFIQIVEDAAQKAEAGNEFAVVKARKKRGRDICALMPALKATNWIGEVEDASTELGGDSGVLMLRLTEGIAAGTWNNSLSDIDANTLIKPSAPLYDKLGSLSQGDSVTFSGRFIRGPDCLEEQSIADENGVLTPDFTFKFTSISEG